MAYNINDARSNFLPVLRNLTMLQENYLNPDANSLEIARNWFTMEALLDEARDLDNADKFPHLDHLTQFVKRNISRLYGLPMRGDAKYCKRQVLKNMILLEDHFLEPNRYCQNCIRKHLLTVEGYLREADNKPNIALYPELSGLKPFFQRFFQRNLKGESKQTLGKALKNVINGFLSTAPEQGYNYNLGQEIRSLRRRLTPILSRSKNVY